MKHKRNQINSFYEAQNDFNKQIMDLNSQESLKFFNKFHESVLDSLFIEKDGEKYQKLHEDFYDLVGLALIGDVSLFPTEWLESTIQRTAMYYDENLDLRRLIELYPIIMDFRSTVFELINPKKLTKNEIKEKREFIKEINDELNENSHIFELFEKYLSKDAYCRNLKFPRETYIKIMENLN